LEQPAETDSPSKSAEDLLGFRRQRFTACPVFFRPLGLILRVDQIVQIGFVLDILKWNRN
jgi:hypothetical protein